MNLQSSLASELSEKEYRDAYVASRLRMTLPRQCRALRESRQWTQPTLAKAAGMSQPRISEIERPGERSPNLETLLRLAAAFDVALQVRFVAFSEWLDEYERLDLDNYYIPAFAEDMDNVHAHQSKLESTLKFKSTIESQASVGWSTPKSGVADAADARLWSQQANRPSKAEDENAA